MNEIASSAIFSFSLRVIGAGLAFFYNIMVARLVGGEGAGLYFLAISITTIGAVIGRVGLDNSLVRFVSTNAANNDWAGVKGAYLAGMRICLAASGFITLLLFSMAPSIADVLFSKPELGALLRWMSLSILPLAVLNLQAESLKGLKRFGNAVTVEGIGVPFIGLLLLFPFVSRIGLEGAGLAYVLATMIVSLSAIVVWNRSIRGQRSVAPLMPTREFYRSCSHLFVVSVLNRAVLPHAPIFMLALWAPSLEVGIFGAASRVAMLVSFVSLTVSHVLAPKVAELYSKGDLRVLSRTAIQTAALVTLITIPAFVLLIFFSEFVMSIYGPEFVAGSRPLSILAAGQFFNVMLGFCAVILIMTGNEKRFSIINIIAFAFQIALLTYLIPRYGASGAAFAGTAATVMVNCVCLYFAIRVLKPAS